MNTGGTPPDPAPSPGRPALLRAINEQAALQVLLDQGPLTRTRIADLTGLSKVTASAVIERLTARGLVTNAGVAGGSRGPNAQTYALVHNLAYVVGLDVDPDRMGAAQGAADFVLVWLGRGIGLALMLSNVLHRGATGAAGEIGFLPVPGAPVQIAAAKNPAPLGGSFQDLVGAETVMRIARGVGISAGSAEAAVRAAVAMGGAGAEVLDELARRLALGVSGVSVIVDPKLVILAGPVGRAGGTALTQRVERAVGEMTLTSPKVVATGVQNEAVLHGVLLAGLDAARRDVLNLD